MLDLKLKKTGMITLDAHGIVCTGFKADGAMCREVAALALLWAIGEMQRELASIIAQPGGTGRVGVD